MIILQSFSAIPAALLLIFLPRLQLPIKYWALSLVLRNLFQNLAQQLPGHLFRVLLYYSAFLFSF